MNKILRYVKTYEDLRKSKLLKEQLSDNDRIYVIEENRVYQYKNGRFVAETIDMKSNVDVSLYDFNKQLVSQLPAISREEAVKMLDDYRWKHSDKNYFMLLSFEKNYYTLLHKTEDKNISGFALLTMECINNIGKLQTLNEEDECMEVWLDIDGEIFLYQLFPYDDGVVEFYG